jgi:glucokinase
VSAVVAIDVGGTGLKGAVLDRGGTLLAQERRPTPRRPDGSADGSAIVDAVLALAGDLMGAVAASEGGGVRVALAVPGLVDDEAGIVALAPNLGWRDLPLRAIAEERLGVPAVVWHDARAAALAEGTLGAARGARDWLLVTIGTGIGGALVSGGNVLLGSRGATGELGHIGVVPDGPLCACGKRGCLEALASGRNISERYAELRGGPGVSAEEVVARAERGDAAAAQVWDAAIDALARALATCAVLLDPELIVLGGGVASAGARLLDPLAARLAQEVRFGPAPQLRTAALGERAGWIGAGLAGWQAAGSAPEALASWPT